MSSKKRDRVRKSKFVPPPTVVPSAVPTVSISSPAPTEPQPQRTVPVYTLAPPPPQTTQGGSDTEDDEDVRVVCGKWAPPKLRQLT